MTSKYRAKPTIVDNIRFASKKEAGRYQELKLLAKTGAIRDLELQPVFTYGIRGEHIFTYRADFAYCEGDNLIIEDVKGFRTPVYKLKKKIIERVYGIQIRET